jgi:hypothetical protein
VLFETPVCTAFATLATRHRPYALDCQLYSRKKQTVCQGVKVKTNAEPKNRIRFNQLEDVARDRLRRFYHLTSAPAALQILQSGAIWSNSPELCPHFTPNRDSKIKPAAAPEIWLSFQFSGAVHLVPEDASVASYQPNALYLHLSEWPDRFGLPGLRVAQVRVAAPTAIGLECTGFRASEAFLKKCRTDVRALLIQERLKRLAATSRAVQVPATEAQRNAIQAAFSELQFGALETWLARLKLWRKRA